MTRVLARWVPGPLCPSVPQVIRFIYMIRKLRYELRYITEERRLKYPMSADSPSVERRPVEEMKSNCTKVMQEPLLL